MRKALAVVSGMHLQIVAVHAADTLRILRDEWHAVEALAELCRVRPTMSAFCGSMRPACPS